MQPELDVLPPPDFIERYGPDGHPAPPRLVQPIEDVIRYDWGTALPEVLSSGMVEVDAALGDGFVAESVTAVIGCTGRGKTALVIQWGRHFLRARPVLVLTSELSRRQMLARFLALVMEWHWRDVYTLPPAEVDRLIAAAPALRGLLVVEVTPGMDLAEVVARYHAETGAVPVIILDYLQHAARRLDLEDPRMAVARVSQTCTDLARRWRTVVILVSSVSRAVAKADTELMSAQDFVTAGAESGSIEFDAGAVLYLDTRPMGSDGSAEARLHVAKNRFGVGNQTVGLKFHGARGMFTAWTEGGLPDSLRDLLEVIKGMVAVAESGRVSEAALRAECKIGSAALRPMLAALAAQGYIRRGVTGIGITVMGQTFKPDSTATSSTGAQNAR